MSDESLRTVLHQRRLVEDAILEAVRPIAVQIGLPHLVDRLTPAVTAVLVELVPWVSAPPAVYASEPPQSTPAPAPSSPPAPVVPAADGDAIALVQQLFNATALSA